MSESLTEVIDRLVQEKTFNLDALEAIKALRDKAIAQEMQIETLKGKYDTQSQSLSKTMNEASDLRNQVAAAKQREEDLIKRERSVFDLEKQAAVANQASMVYREVFGTVFRNTVVRENALKSVVQPPQYVGGPSTTFPANETTTRETDPLGT